MGIIQGVGKTAYNIANTKIGSLGLLAGTGIFLARKIADNIQKRNAQKNTEPSVKTPEWLTKSKSRREELLREELLENRQIPNYPRSIANFIIKRKNNYFPKIAFDRLQDRRLLTRRWLSIAKAKTGYGRAKDLGKISA